MLLFEHLTFYNNIENPQIGIIVSIFIISTIMYLIRTQTFITDYQYLNGMVPLVGYPIIQWQY